ncbi:hypothetical protein HHI36_016344 [Cryptolaemus montrouzieri]|uniref:Uncharacterized protein n=1 Tax=Cryptolaemus montrouzieri TaxID=559131 RepID=A0ABD2NJU8_9CUCU
MYRFIPLKTFAPSRYPKWFNSELIHMVRRKNRADRQYKRTGSREDYLRFRELRAACRELGSCLYSRYIDSVESGYDQLTVMYLVEYIEDGIKQVVPEVRRTKSSLRAKYLDGRYYHVRILAKNDSEELLLEIKRNIECHIPFVTLYLDRQHYNFVDNCENIVDSTPKGNIEYEILKEALDHDFIILSDIEQAEVPIRDAHLSIDDGDNVLADLGMVQEQEVVSGRSDDDEVDEEIDDLYRTNKKWARISFTGKLGKNTALLVHRDLGFKAIDLILKYREKAGVNPLNRFIFGEPSRFHSQNTFQACQLIRKLAQESGIENSQLLRTRLLRQHLATETATSSVDERLEGRVSDFMSHKRQIHQDYYVMTQKKDDITKVSRLLENFSTSKREHKSESKKQSPRVSWSAVEKATAREYFHDEIYFGDRITREKINKFFQEEKRVYSKRTPHLIMQWVKGQKKRYYQQERRTPRYIIIFFQERAVQCEFNRNINKINMETFCKRNRWSTPEKEVLRSSTEKHSAGGTIPTLSECENIFEQNEGVLQGRNPKSIKAYIHRQLRCDNPQFNNNKV